MADYNIRSDSVNVEQIMDQIRSRIRDKRGVDYTEKEIRELAAVKLEKFLDPRGVRSDLLAEFRKTQPPPAPYEAPLYTFEDTTLFESHRGIVRFFRRLLKPLLKLFFNPNVLSHVLHAQAEINRQNVERVQNLEASLRQSGDLYYELLHNLVLELTRATIEVKNMKMQVESLAARLEFNERRARALESAVVYRPASDAPRVDRSARAPERRPEPLPPVEGTAAPVAAAAPGSPPGSVPAADGLAEGPGQRSRRRRRRRGRRGGASAVAMMGGPAPQAPGQPPPDSGEVADDEADDAAAVSSAPFEAVSSDRTAQPEDGRDTRPEPFEHAFGSSTHPAEAAPPRTDEPPDQ